MSALLLDSLVQLTAPDLRTLATLLRSGRLTPPCSKWGIGQCLGSEEAARLAEALEFLRGESFQPSQIAQLLEILAASWSRTGETSDLVDLVTSGPEAAGIANRDTAVVVRELFVQARRSVMVAGYAVYQGREVFRALAERMNQLPELKVRFFLDVQRGPGDTSMSTDVAMRFAQRFRTREWPQGCRLPEIYYDPRSLDQDAQKKTSLHAKCIVIYDELAFVSSANFTAAAQLYNIELGVLIRMPAVARRITAHFDALASASLLTPLLL